MAWTNPVMFVYYEIKVELCFCLSESESVAETATGVPPGSPVTKRPSLLKSGSKPTVVSPLENIEVNHGENITLQVKIMYCALMQYVSFD